MELWRLFAHNHWFTLNIIGCKIRLCARCSGYLLGLSITYSVSTYLSEYFKVRIQNIPWYIYILLAAPLVLDWITQSWGLRTSNNYLRLITGCLIGIDMFLFTKYFAYFQQDWQIFIVAALIVTIIGLIGKINRFNLTQRIE